MNTPQVFASTPSAIQWMESNRMHMTRDAHEYAGKSVSMWPGIAMVPFLALGGLTTNTSIDYAARIDSGYTNPVISLDRKTLDWPDEENGEAGAFLSFLDSLIEAHPEWIVSADEAQLDRIARLLINVKV